MNKLATLKHIKNLYNAAKGFRRIKLAAYRVDAGGVYDSAGNRVSTHGNTGKYGYAWWDKDKWNSGYTDDADLATAMHQYNSSYNSANYKNLQSAVGKAIGDTPMDRAYYDNYVATKLNGDTTGGDKLANPSSTTTTTTTQTQQQAQPQQQNTVKYVKYTPGTTSEYNLTEDEAQETPMVVSKAFQQLLNAGMGIDEKGNYNPEKYAKPETASVEHAAEPKAAAFKPASKAMPNAFRYILKKENR